MSHLQIDFSVILCAYNEHRWRDLVAAIDSLQSQTAKPLEIIVVVDNNARLLERVRSSIPDVVSIKNGEKRGLAGARNSGVGQSRGEIIAFLDDDAIASNDWLERLSACYEDPKVLGAGGSIVPIWPARKPLWFPEEFFWVVGCTYLGMPENTTPVRNLIGANMSFRREVLKEIRFFSGIGHLGSRPLGGSDPDFCIRVKQRWQDGLIIYHPQARVYHRIKDQRARWRYFCLRCYNEGISKSILTRRVGGKTGLASEKLYSLKTLPRGIVNGFADGLRGDMSGVIRSGAILAGFALTATGYLVEKTSYLLRPSRQTAESV